MRCWFCLREFSEEELGQQEFTPPHPSTNAIRAARGELCPSSGDPLIDDDDPRVVAWLRWNAP